MAKQKPSKSRPRSAQSVMWLMVLALLFAFYYFYTRPSTPAAAPPTTPTITATGAATAPAQPAPATDAAFPAAAALAAPTASSGSGSAAALSATPRPARATPTRGPPATIDGLPTILPDDLPREALDTLDLIDRGGPFPFSRDGVVFQNRERLLPRRPQDYYLEYTVITPGSSDRGARRIIAGEAGERYYTDDHYDSFYVVVEYP